MREANRGSRLYAEKKDMMSLIFNMENLSSLQGIQMEIGNKQLAMGSRRGI